MAESAHVLRFGEDRSGQVARLVPPAQLLSVRRHQDTAHDLWTTMNVLQENAIRGGLTAWDRDVNNRRRQVATRPVNGIGQAVNLNRALWLLGDRMAETKGAAA